MYFEWAVSEQWHLVVKYFQGDLFSAEAALNLQGNPPPVFVLLFQTS